jgi:hypothetical protein
VTSFFAKVPDVMFPVFGVNHASCFPEVNVYAFSALPKLNMAIHEILVIAFQRKAESMKKQDGVFKFQK